MHNGSKHQGVVVPMVTPVTASGELDEAAVARLVTHLLAGGVHGIFVLGTTGEGFSVPQPLRRRLVEHTVARVQRRALVYAGTTDDATEAVAAGNSYLQMGVDAVVVRAPANYPAERLLSFFRSLLDGMNGPVLLYNIPITTNVSIPLDIIEQLVGHRNLIGIKDSENDPERLQELVRRFGNIPAFSIFVGVGSLMGMGLKLGAAGIVPSVGNLIPDDCHRLCDSARRGDWLEAEKRATRMLEVASIYQKGRTLDESLAALKAALACRGICSGEVLPPLETVSAAEVERLRHEMAGLNLLS